MWLAVLVSFFLGLLSSTTLAMQWQPFALSWPYSDLYSHFIQCMCTPAWQNLIVENVSINTVAAASVHCILMAARAAVRKQCSVGGDSIHLVSVIILFSVFSQLCLECRHLPLNTQGPKHRYHLLQCLVLHPAAACHRPWAGCCTCPSRVHWNTQRDLLHLDGPLCKASYFWSTSNLLLGGGLSTHRWYQFLIKVVGKHLLSLVSVGDGASSFLA